MKASLLFINGAACALLLAAAGCDRGGERTTAAGVRETRFPGQVTANGGTSGQVLARTAKPATDATYAGGTPGIAGGSGGTTGGAATGGTVQETGHGPSRGVTPPSSVGQPGTTPETGDREPAPPAPNEVVGGMATHRDSPAPAAPKR